LCSIGCTYDNNKCDVDECLLLTLDECLGSCKKNSSHCFNNPCENLGISPCVVSEYCGVVEGYCLFDTCATEDSCVYPCVEDNDNCVLSLCSQYTSVSCSTQTTNYCKIELMMQSVYQMYFPWEGVNRLDLKKKIVI
jgi:hypothetical protein